MNEAQKAVGLETPPERKKDAGDILGELQGLFRERNKVYGSNYFDFGEVMQALFPAGMELKTVDDFNRAGILFHQVDKLMRDCKQFAVGGHADSKRDLSVYSAIALEIDEASKGSW